MGTYLPLIVPAFTAGAYYTFLLRQSFMGIPMSYNEAAKLEGADGNLSGLLSLVLFLCHFVTILTMSWNMIKAIRPNSRTIPAMWI